ncbi:MAG: hypothetical protein SNJ77_09675 [Cytophagales bacterium]
MTKNSLETLEMLRQYMSQFGKINDEDLQQMSEMMKIKSFAKNTILLSEDQAPNKCFLC